MPHCRRNDVSEADNQQSVGTTRYRSTPTFCASRLRPAYAIRSEAGRNSIMSDQPIHLNPKRDEGYEEYDAERSQENRACEDDWLSSSAVRKSLCETAQPRHP